MRGLKSKDLVAMIDFLYFGEANVSQENLDSFLVVAEELQLKGLMGSGAEEEEEEINNKLTKKKLKNPEQKRTFIKQEAPSHISSSEDLIETSPSVKGTVAVTDFTVAADLEDLDDMIKSMMLISENKTKDGTKKARICKECGKEGRWIAIRNHIEAHHITGVSHTCNICGKISKSRNALKNHRLTYHKMHPLQHQIIKLNYL